jgi:glutathionylspermidine amidase/synthetase
VIGIGPLYRFCRLQGLTDIDARAGKKAPFGEILGYAPLNVAAYSSDYGSASFGVWVSFPFKGLTSQAGGNYYGFKYQCVEFARRWLVQARGFTFADVPIAYSVFDMPFAIRISDQSQVPFDCVPNGSGKDRRRPELGSILIWNVGGRYEGTGHIAIVTEANDKFVRVAEQNVDDTYWARGQNYSRELPVTFFAESGAYTIHDPSGPTSTIRGWMHIGSAS